MQSMFVWAFLARECPNCKQYSGAGWADDKGVWYCEECQMNCMLDLFDTDCTSPSKTWLRSAGEYAVQVPLLAGYYAGAVTWKAAKLGSTVALAGFRLAFASKPHGVSLTSEDLKGPWEIVDDPKK